jgi:DNA-binding XRE family transcriptional regulator
MTAEELIMLRKAFGLNQTDMAEGIGLKLRAYADLEAGVSELQKRHELAIERFGLTLAVERDDPMLAPASVRKEALALALLITDGKQPKPRPN